ncbi:S28 family serine protease [candidate division KSB1 bacterium]
MKTKKKFGFYYFLILTVLLILPIQGFSQQGEKQDSELFKWLKTIPGMEIDTIRVPRDSVPAYKEAYRIMLEQPLDHKDPDGKKFKQQIYVSHLDKSKPVVLVTRGYTIGRNRPVELSRLLDANQIVVEHRFFWKSVPEEMEWKYLTIKQAAADHHRITTLFKQFYSGKWVNTGVSKGGQTALFHRRFYPDDVDVTVAYVAPINAALHDKRVNFFIDKRVGTQKERELLRQFQIRILENRDAVLPIFIEDTKKSKLTFPIGDEMAFEYIVLEYTFSFWQYGDGDISKVPGENATPQEMLDHLKKVVGFRTYSASGMNSPSMYQNHTEIGYYSYVDGHLKQLLKKVKDPTNIIFAPEYEKIKFDPSVIKDITRWLMYEGNNIIYINGGNDPWGAPVIELTGNTNAVKIIVENRNHGVKIRHCTDKQKDLVFSHLEKWLDMKIKRD